MSWGYADKNIKDLKENRNFVANHMNWTQKFLFYDSVLGLTWG